MKMFFWLLLSIFIHAGQSQFNLHTEVDIGGCFDTTTDEFVHCAAVEKECEEIGNVRFRSAKQLKFIELDPCTPEQLVVGTCGDTGACALTEDACDDPSQFVAPMREDDGITSGECKARGIIIENVFRPTQYGGCKDGVTGNVACMLTPDDCTKYEAWIPASAAEKLQQGGCRCNDVRVGLCPGFGSSHGGASDPGRCAISQDDCEFSAFVPPADVLSHPALLDCRLCDKSSELEISPTTDVPTKNPTHVPTKNPTHVPTTNPTYVPTKNPTHVPTTNPSTSYVKTAKPFAYITTAEPSPTYIKATEPYVSIANEGPSSASITAEPSSTNIPLTSAETSLEIKAAANNNNEQMESSSGGLNMVVIISSCVAFGVLLLVGAVFFTRQKKKSRLNEHAETIKVPSGTMN